MSGQRMFDIGGWDGGDPGGRMDSLAQAKFRRPGNVKLLKVLRGLPGNVAMSSFVDPMSI